MNVFKAHPLATGKNKTEVESVQLGYLLKSSNFVAQKAAVLKKEVEFRQMFGNEF